MLSRYFRRKRENNLSNGIFWFHLKGNVSIEIDLELSFTIPTAYSLSGCDAFALPQSDDAEPERAHGAKTDAKFHTFLLDLRSAVS
jgi:hypothetical protein